MNHEVSFSSEKFKKRSLSSQSQGKFFQPKLTINEPNDQYEREADATADRVMRMENAGIQLKPLPISSVQRKCAECGQEEKVQLQRKETNTRFDISHKRNYKADIAEASLPGNIIQKKCPACEEENEMHRKEVNAKEITADSGFEDYVSHLNSGGQLLPQEVRSFYEPRFGYNFSNVKVHADAIAAKSAQSVNALAYTSGTHIVFNSGQYAPGTENGKRLLAHELTHVVQQGNGIQTKEIQRRIGDGHDLNAARFSGNVVLEGVYDNERLLLNGSKGAAVRILQQALIDSGMTLPVHGVDGDFGPETENAVMTFQRASGLSGGDRDGIVGPTTMGWLDQRFSTAATPAGATSGATTGCAAFKTINVDIASLRGSTRNPGADLEYANSVFNQCCIKFNFQKGVSALNSDSDSWLGGDSDLNKSAACGSLTAEEGNLTTSAVATLGLSSRFRVFYVDTISGRPRAYSYPPYCATGLAAGARNMAFVSNSAQSRSLAHEFGHILLNNGNHPMLVPNNLMHPTNTATGEDLDPTDCTTVFANA